MPTVEGEITVLSMHAAYIGILAPGAVKIQHVSGEEDLAISGGFVEVSNQGKTLTLSVQMVDRASELTAEAIAAATERARQVMKNTIGADDPAYAAAAAGLQHEFARDRVFARYKARRVNGLPMNEQGSVAHNENAE